MRNILFVASEPESQSSTKCSKEYDVLEDLRIPSRFKETFNISLLNHATSDKLIDRIKDLSPEFLHYCGHGNADGEFMILGDNGKVVPFRSDMLASCLKRNQRLECVVFCSCNSKELVEEIKAYSEYAIGFEGKVNNDAMRKFTEDFYKELFNTGSVYSAFLYTCEKIKARIQQGGYPILRTKFNDFMKSIYVNELTATQAKALAIEKKINVSDQLLEQVEQDIFSANKAYQEDFRAILLTHNTPDEVLWFSKSKDQLALEVANLLFRKKSIEAIEDFAEELKLLFLGVETALLYYPKEELIQVNIYSAIDGSEYTTEDFVSALDELELIEFGVPKRSDFDILYKKVIELSKSIVLNGH